MIITTTPTIEGHPIGEYLGVVAGEAILGAHVGRDILASLTDIIGGRSAEYEQEVRKARTIALEEMSSAAGGKGANAVVGVDIDYEVIRQGMLMVSVSGRENRERKRVSLKEYLDPHTNRRSRDRLQRHQLQRRQDQP
jgi:uncharacterized protein YbjQ (UPF0145 family)